MSTEFASYFLVGFYKVWERSEHKLLLPFYFGRLNESVKVKYKYDVKSTFCILSCNHYLVHLLSVSSMLSLWVGSE